jgi:acyl dehydratase
MRLRLKSQILVANVSNQGERVVELISRRNMLAAATAAGGLLTAASVAAAQPHDDFDPVNFTVVPPRRFEDLRVGDVFRAPSRTLTDAHAAAFQTVSADNHPIHYDVEYARRHGHIAPVVHGLQVFAFTAPGATLFPQYIGDVFVAFTSASCKFLKEVHAGDTLYPALEIIALSPEEGDTGRVTTRAGPQPMRCCRSGKLHPTGFAR